MHVSRVSKILYKIERLCLQLARICFIFLTVSMYYNSIITQSIDSTAYWFM